ncbi:MAG: HlyD family secretion protein, partial [Isosphaeraceae bacterium]
MRHDAKRRTGRLVAWLGVALAAGLVSAVAAVATGASSTTPTFAKVPTGLVRREPFYSTVVAAGRVESSQSTEIRCALSRLSSGLSSTILTMIDDGSNVKKGEVLAELDSSGYVEMVRRQQIVVDQAQATHDQAKLRLEVAEINLQAQKLGVMAQTDKQMRSQIALAESDLNRQEDRLAWTRRMLEKGYLPEGQVMTEEQTLRRAELTLKQARTALENYQRFSAPKQLRGLESAINSAKASLDYETIRLNREVERLKLYQEMVDQCVVRAPHDGFVIYANRAGREQEVYVGATVRERMRLFNLPDLSRMEVEVLLHETIVDGIKPGMPARLQVAALPGKTYEGVIKSVAPLPYAERRRESGDSQITYFVGRVTLTSNPEGLRPGMTAELEILAGTKDGVLVV